VILLLIVVGVLVVMWFLLIRPQRQRQLQQEDMLTRLEPGVEIVTAGGFYGTVVDIDEDGDELHVEIAPDTVVRLAKRAVAMVVPDEEEDEYEDEYEDEDDEEIVDEAEGAPATEDEPDTEAARSASSPR
jgi:preprotein translocase subunit YajC